MWIKLSTWSPNYYLHNVENLLEPKTDTVRSFAPKCVGTFKGPVLLGDLRFEYEYEVEYENKNNFLILLCRLYIITTHTHFIPWTTLSA